MLVGRASEQAKLDDLLAEARKGKSRVLVVRGSAGIGKSALLDYAVQQAEGMQVLQVTAVESEAELAFAGLDALLRPLVPHLGAIPEAQARPLRTALALERAEQVEGLAISAGALSLLAEGAELAPVLAVVDDAHWLDQPSAATLAFLARRVRAESLALLFTVREGEGSDFGQGLPELQLGPLTEAASLELLGQRFGARIAPDVAGRLARETDGNPLGLLEFASLLGEEERAGRAPLPQHLPVSESVERRVRLALQELPDETREALLLAAASDSPVGLETAKLGPAERAALVRLHAGAVRFRHPLVRAAIYQAAPADERQEAHRALAEALTEPEDADRSAWHLAAAAEGPDEAVASALEAAASRFAARGGRASESRALERAAELSADDDASARRLHAAGRASFSAGEPERALRLLQRGGNLARDPAVRADLAHLRWVVTATQGVPLDKAEVVREVERVTPHDPARAALFLHLLIVDAFLRLDLRTGITLARRSVALCEAAGIQLPEENRGKLALLLFYAGQSAEGEEVAEGCERAELITGFWVGVEKYERARTLVDRALKRYRADGSVLAAMYINTVVAELELRLGRFGLAEAAAGEALDVAETVGSLLAIADALVVLASIAAIRGREQEAHAYAGRADEASRLAGSPVRQASAAIARGLLELGLGRPVAAIEHLRPAADLAEHVGIREPAALPYAPELIEAYARVGDRDSAERELRRLEEQARAVNRRWALADAARLRGFLGPDEELETHFEHALEIHESGPASPFERARTELLYGERLRRAKRKKEAREQLRAAVERFDALGAAPWSERARAELAASGERIPHRDPTAPEKLTPQELQIALQVAQGKSNREVAAALFLSPKTVEYHLTHVYRKLDLHSRAELIRLLATSARPESAIPA